MKIQSTWGDMTQDHTVPVLLSGQTDMQQWDKSPYECIYPTITLDHIYDALDTHTTQHAAPSQHGYMSARKVLRDKHSDACQAVLHDILSDIQMRTAWLHTAPRMPAFTNIRGGNTPATYNERCGRLLFLSQHDPLTRDTNTLYTP